MSTRTPDRNATGGIPHRDAAKPSDRHTAALKGTSAPTDLLRGDDIQPFDISGDHEVRDDNNPGRRV